MNLKNNNSPNKLLQVIQIILGVSMLFAAFTKVSTINSFITSLLQDYGIGFLALGAPILILIEVFLGLNLILFRNAQRTAFVNIWFLVALTGFYFYGHVFHTAESCKCFGGYLNLFSSPSSTYIRNVIMIALSYLVMKNTEDKPVKYSSVIILTIILLSSFIMGLNINKTFFFRVAHQTTTQQKNKITTISNASKKLAEQHRLDPQKTYMLFYFSLKCNYCLNSLENVKCYKEQGIVDSIIFINVTQKPSPQLKKLLKMHDILEDNYSIKYITKEAFHKLSHVSPTSYFFKKNKVIKELKGMVPSPTVFSRTNNELFTQLKQ